MNLAAVFLIAATLWYWGQPLISESGTVRLWVNNIFSGENSQQIADWYTLSHFLHGVLVVLLGRWFFPRFSVKILFLVAVTSGVAWEIVEHSEWVLAKFRATTIDQGYEGDSVLNAVCDYLFMMAGFITATKLSTKALALLFVCMELVSGLIGRDNLTMTSLRLVYPIEAIENWQQELRPATP